VVGINDVLIVSLICFCVVTKEFQGAEILVKKSVLWLRTHSSKIAFVDRAYNQ